MPAVKPGESRGAYVKRCIPIVIGEGSTPEQAAGKCNGMWEAAQKEDEKECGGKKRRRQKESVFNGGFVQSVPSPAGDVEVVSMGKYPEVPTVELPDHLKPSFMRPREIDQLKQP